MTREVPTGPRRSRAVGFVAAAVLMAVISVGITALLARLNAPAGVSTEAAEGAPGADLLILKAEIQRRRPALDAEREAIAAERTAIEAERSSLETLRALIERRRRRGLLAVERQLDRRDSGEHERRLKALSARIDAFNERLAAHKQAVAEFNTLVTQFNAAR